MVFKPDWLYGIEIWGTASPGNIETIQRAKNKILMSIVNPPWFTKVTQIHEYTAFPFVKDEIAQAEKHRRAT